MQRLLIILRSAFSPFCGFQGTRLPFVLLAAVAVAIMLGTLAERRWGTASAHRMIYAAPWFYALWAAFAVSTLRTLVLRRLWRNPAVGGLHVGLMVVLCGGALSAAFSSRGCLHVRVGQTAAVYADTLSGRTHLLPFPLVLDSVETRYYPGTTAPRDYLAHLRLSGRPCTVATNRIVCASRHRLCLQRFDADGQGCVLGVSHDPWGTAVSYSGYVILALCMMGCLLKDVLGRWVRGCRLRLFPFVLLLYIGPADVLAHPAPSRMPLPVPPDTTLQRCEREQVVWNDRIVPLATVAHEVLLKVYGKTSYRGLTPMQVLASFTLAPKRWAAERIIRLPDGGRMACLNDFVDYAHTVPQLKGVGQDARVDEKVALLLMLRQGVLVQPLPDTALRRSALSIEAEIRYYRTDWTGLALLLCMAGVGATLLLRLLSTRPSSAIRPWRCRPGRMLPAGLCFAAWAVMTVALALRTLASGRLPLSSLDETMMLMAWLMLTVVLLVEGLRREGWMLLAVAFLLRTSGESKPAWTLHSVCRRLPVAILLLLVHLKEADPAVGPLPPVLHSPWLNLHVGTIMLAYALLPLSIVDRRLLRPAVFFLATGIFVGAVWANEAWGTYWSWDPKESWALITLLVYSLPLHTRSLPWFRSPLAYRLYSLLALVSLAMTYWGVNHWLGGQHAY